MAALRLPVMCLRLAFKLMVFVIVVEGYKARLPSEVSTLFLDLSAKKP